MTRALVLLVSAALVAGPARADGPPAPPPPEAWAVLEPGASWTAPAAGGALCLDRRAWTFQVEKQRWLETRARAAEDVAEGQFLRGMLWGVAVGVAVGAAVGALVAR